MLHSTLAHISAAIPSRIKLELSWIRPLYTRIVSALAPEVTISSAAGTFRWKPDQLTSQRHLLGTYEPDMQAAFLRYLRPGDVVFDIGSHAGFHALFCELVVRPGGAVFAFEPNESNRRSLQRQLRANVEARIHLLPFAVSERCGVAMFNDRKHSQSHISELGKAEVDARTIDSLVRAGLISIPTLIKIDVEGHERQVLAGARTTIQNSRPVILVDYNDGQTLSTVESQLHDLNYEVSPGPPVTAYPREKFSQ